MSPTLLVLACWIFLALAFTGLWEWQRRHCDGSIVDVGWSFSLGFLALSYAFFLDGDPLRRGLLGLAVGAWSVRLGLFLWRHRIAAGKPEDGRYQALRAHWGRQAQPKFWFFFQFQAVAAILLSLPWVVLLTRLPEGPGLWDALGAAWILGAVLLEKQADNQLQAWRDDPSKRGQVCRSGWWARSRHPNYFFEWCHWLGYPIMGLPLLLSGAWGAWLTLWFGPAVMLFLLLRGTGIPYTELQALKSRGAAYAQYQREVPAFVPRLGSAD